MKKKILIIEDELALQKTFSDILEKEGYQVISALNGESGLMLAKKENPDLILLDLILPQKDGFEVLKELKKDETTNEIPVIVLTNLEDIQSVERAVELGAKTYLVKAQYTLKEVIQKIKDELEK
jgi:DNA-binding response OmpR family regulator